MRARMAPALTFAQVTTFPPEVCKTVGSAFPGSNRGFATTSGEPTRVEPDRRTHGPNLAPVPSERYWPGS
jgi:hypothetical protein